VQSTADAGIPSVGAMGENTGTPGDCIRNTDVVVGSLARNPLRELMSRGADFADPSA